MNYNLHPSHPSQNTIQETVQDLRPGLERLTYSDGTTERRWSSPGQIISFTSDKSPGTGDHKPLMIAVEEWHPNRGSETRIIGIANGIVVEYEPSGKPTNPQAWANITYGAQRAVGDTAREIIPTLTVGAQIELPYQGYGRSGRILSVRALDALGARIDGEPSDRNAMDQLVYDSEGSDQWRALLQATKLMRDGKDNYHRNMDPRAKQPTGGFNPKLVTTLGGVVKVGEKHKFDFLKPKY